MSAPTPAGRPRYTGPAAASSGHARAPIERANELLEKDPIWKERFDGLEQKGYPPGVARRIGVLLGATEVDGLLADALGAVEVYRGINSATYDPAFEGGTMLAAGGKWATHRSEDALEFTAYPLSQGSTDPGWVLRMYPPARAAEFSIRAEDGTPVRTKFNRRAIPSDTPWLEAIGRGTVVGSEVHAPIHWLSFEDAVQQGVIAPLPLTKLSAEVQDLLGAKQDEPR